MSIDRGAGRRRTALPSFSRRTFVLGASAAGLVASAPVAAGRLAGDPFTLGVASGDPAPDGMVLWTRLAVDPLAPDGLGGMPGRAVTVEWELATDERFTAVERRGAVDAGPDTAHAVHVEPAGLAPGREYFYRFRTGRHLSPAGRTRTAPPPGALDPVSTCVASCSNYPVGWFTAYRRLAEDRPDLVLHLGDYQYEYPTPDASVRPVAGAETTELAGYRQRYAQYKSDPDLQAAHAVAPWLVVWDDHEVDDDWAGEVPEDAQPREAFLARRAAAFRAYHENMPLRLRSVPRGPDIRIYRRIGWGGLATFHLLDTRRYRDDQACGNGFRVGCAERLEPGRSLPGMAQEQWLAEGFRRSRARWDVVGQQVFFAARDTDPGPAERVAMDGWDGYAPSRDRVTRSWVDAGIRNAVVLTGNVHTHWANELKLDYADPAAPVVGTELVSSSITSGGDGDAATDHPDLHTNPHLRFRSNRRGYVRAVYEPGLVRADFRVVDAVTTPGAPVRTAGSFVIPDREPGLHSA